MKRTPDPSTLPLFEERDFAAYEEHRQRDPEYNPYRLRVRRKLDLYAKAAKAALKKEHGLNLASRTSLNHPYRFNLGRVRAQWAYLSRSPKDRKALVERVGDTIGQDVDTHYIQTTIVCCLDAEGLETSLRIHPLAFWDAINLRNLCATREGAAVFLSLLADLPEGFVLTIDRWRREYLPGRLEHRDLENFFAYFRPGEHWWNLRRRFPREAGIAMGPELRERLLEGLVGLGPLYRFFVWSPSNDHCFDAEGRIRRNG